MWWIFGKKKKEALTPVDGLSPEEIRHMHIAAETQAVFGGKIAGKEFIPSDYPVSTLADVITDPRRKLGYIPLALRVIFCILWHFDRRIAELEKKLKATEIT